MESGAIADIQVTSSSLTRDHNYFNVTYGRLHSTSASWIANYHNSWLQVDLNSVHRVTRVATQGDQSWVTKYNLQYRNDSGSFQYYKEPEQNTQKVKLTSSQSD